MTFQLRRLVMIPTDTEMEAYALRERILLEMNQRNPVLEPIGNVYVTTDVNLIGVFVEARDMDEGEWNRINHYLSSVQREVEIEAEKKK